jgi:hypothetical protein
LVTVKAELHSRGKSYQTIDQQTVCEEFNKLPRFGASDANLFVCLLLHGHGKADLPNAQKIMGKSSDGQSTCSLIIPALTPVSTSASLSIPPRRCLGLPVTRTAEARREAEANPKAA